MTAPNMAAITASLERSLQNFSLNRHRRHQSSVGAGEGTSSSDETDSRNHDLLQNSDASLELNSHVTLPYHWEQCLDLKVINRPLFRF